MSRYPLKEKIADFLDVKTARFGPGTLRRYDALLKDFARLTDRNPAIITPDEVLEILKVWRMRVDKNTFNSYVSSLNVFLKFCGNVSIETLKSRDAISTAVIEKPLRRLSKKEIETILRCVDPSSTEDWDRWVEGLFIFGYAFTMLRNREWRLVDLEDLDMSRGVVRIRNPKGVGSWSSPFSRDLHPTLLDLIERYLPLRMRRLAELGYKPEDLPRGGPLIPVIQGMRVGHYTVGGLYKMQRRIARRCGVAFTVKDFRSSCAHILRTEANIPLERIAKHLRHKSVKTTERWYDRIEDDEIKDEIGLLDLGV